MGNRPRPRPAICGLPLVTCGIQTATNPVTGRPELRFTFRRRLDPGALTHTLQTSSDFVEWSNHIPATDERSVTANPDGSTETVVAFIPLDSGRLLVRLQVTAP